MFLNSSQSKLNLNPSLVAKESSSVEKDLNAKESHENVHSETEPTASVSNESRQDKRVETRNSGSHKVKVYIFKLLMKLVPNRK